MEWKECVFVLGSPCSCCCSFLLKYLSEEEDETSQNVGVICIGATRCSDICFGPIQQIEAETEFFLILVINV